MRDPLIRLAESAATRIGMEMPEPWPAPRWLPPGEQAEWERNDAARVYHGRRAVAAGLVSQTFAALTMLLQIVILVLVAGSV